MPAEQKEIYYLTGEIGASSCEHSPYLEAFRAKGQDVLLLTDPVDEFVFPTCGEYKGKSSRPADRGERRGADEVPADVKETVRRLLIAP